MKQNKQILSKNYKKNKITRKDAYQFISFSIGYDYLMKWRHESYIHAYTLNGFAYSGQHD